MVQASWPIMYRWNRFFKYSFCPSLLFPVVTHSLLSGLQLLHGSYIFCPHFFFVACPWLHPRSLWKQLRYLCWDRAPDLLRFFPSVPGSLPRSVCHICPCTLSISLRRVSILNPQSANCNLPNLVLVLILDNVLRHASAFQHALGIF